MKARRGCQVSSRVKCHLFAFDTRSLADPIARMAVSKPRHIPVSVSLSTGVIDRHRTTTGLLCRHWASNSDPPMCRETLVHVILHGRPSSNSFAQSSGNYGEEEAKRLEEPEEMDNYFKETLSSRHNCMDTHKDPESVTSCRPSRGPIRQAPSTVRGCEHESPPLSLTWKGSPINCKAKSSFSKGVSLSIQAQLRVGCTPSNS